MIGIINTFADKVTQINLDFIFLLKNLKNVTIPITPLYDKIKPKSKITYGLFKI